jgi:hypothetical protein
VKNGKNFEARKMDLMKLENDRKITPEARKWSENNSMKLENNP